MELKVLQSLIEDAKIAYSDYPIMQRVVVTQGIHESHMNSPRGASQLALRCNNLFGIKGTGDVGSKSFPTWEYEDGENIQVDANFAVYSSHEACFEAHRKLMEHARYAPVLASETVEEAFKQLQRCGYATDPNYPASLQIVYDNIVKDAFDEN